MEYTIDNSYTGKKCTHKHRKKENRHPHTAGLGAGGRVGDPYFAKMALFAPDFDLHNTTHIRSN